MNLFKKKPQFKNELIGEKVFPNGVFVGVFKIKMLHLVLSDDSNDFMRIAKLMSLTVLLDSKQLSLEEVLNLDRQFAEDIIQFLLESNQNVSYISNTK